MTAGGVEDRHVHHLQLCLDRLHRRFGGVLMWFRRNSVAATLMKSADAVPGGPPGAYFVTKNQTEFHLRCPCGRCTKSNVLPLVAGRGSYTWSLSGPADKPSLSPSIHWFEKDGNTTHWHGWLRDGYFEG